MSMENQELNVAPVAETEEKVENQEAEVKAEEAAQAENAEAENAAEEPKEPTLEEKYAALEKENAELKDQLLRRAADFDNYRKRMFQPSP